MKKTRRGSQEGDGSGNWSGRSITWRASSARSASSAPADWDYLIKVATRGMKGYDSFYKRLTTDIDLATVTGFFSMEAIIDDRPVDLMHER